MLELLRTLGITADYYAGHSLGAITALYASGAISLEDLIRITRERGLLMKEASAQNPGGMIAINASVQDCGNYLALAGSAATVANINSPEQTVLSGDTPALGTLVHFLNHQNIAYKVLPVTTPFHSQHLAPAQAPFRRFLEDIAFKDATIPVLSGLNAQNYPNSAAALRTTLAEEICAPVQFMASILELYSQGVRIFLEVGPRNILSNLVRRILRPQPFLALAIDENDDPQFSLWNTLAQLAVAGVPIHLECLREEFASATNPQASSYAVMVNGANIRPQLANTIHGNPPVAQEFHEAPVAKDKRKERPHMDSRENNRISPREEDAVPVSLLDTARHIHLELARVHSDFQRTFSETHLAFLKSTETCLSLLFQTEKRTSSTTQASKNHALIDAQESTKLLPLIKENLSPTPSQRDLPSLPAPAAEPFKFPTLSRMDKASQTDFTVEERPNDETDTSPDLAAALLAVIAEKTGYPQELIKLEMSLDTDLGIDSIKRVEIFSCLAEKLPQANAIDSQEMTKLGTLEEIVKFLAEKTSTELNFATKKNSTQFPNPHQSILNA